MQEKIKHLYHKAYLMRIDIIKMLAEAGSGHPGGSLSLADIVSVLFFHKMNYTMDSLKSPDRDKIVFSKGHAAPVLYAALKQIGCVKEEELMTLRRLGSRLQGHPDKQLLECVEVSTGSLGQGFSAAIGLGLAHRLDKKKGTIYAMLGDGEIQEGQIWEGAMFAAAKKVDNLVAILDRNRLQIDGCTEDVCALDPLTDKWQSFGWEVICVEGHDIQAVIKALDQADEVKGKPTIIIAHTTKGKGVSFMENNVNFHGVAPSKDEEKTALEELQKELVKYE